MADSPWPTIVAERKALASDLEKLTEKKWKSPSLCEGWTVQQVLGHLTAQTRISGLAFFPKVIAAGFSLDKMVAKDIVLETSGTGAETLARFLARAESTSHPPGPSDTWLGECIVHGEDIRRPLGIKHTYPPEALARVANFYRRSNLVIGGKRRAAGLRFRATDTDYVAGEGPEVTGPMRAIVSAIAGRGAALDDLSGDGLVTLKERF